MDHISKYLGEIVAERRSSGLTPTPGMRDEFYVPVDPALQPQFLANVEAARRKRLEKHFGQRIEVPRRYRNLTPGTIKNRRGKEEAIKAATTWAAGGGDKPGLVLQGGVGVGKSALGWWAVPQRGWGLWLTWPEFYRTVQDGYGNGEAEARIKAAQAVPVLFLDDLGDPDRIGQTRQWRKQGEDQDKTLRMATDDQRDILFRVVNYRCKEWLPLFVTTNLDGTGLLAQFGDRIVSRLLELCQFVTMGGVDLRRV